MFGTIGDAASLPCAKFSALAPVLGLQEQPVEMLLNPCAPLKWYLNPQQQEQPVTVDLLILMQPRGKAE